MTELSGIFTATDFENMPPACEKPLAMAFINKQTDIDAFDIPVAFSKGTLFKKLDKPLLAGGNVG